MSNRARVAFALRRIAQLSAELEGRTSSSRQIAERVGDTLQLTLNGLVGDNHPHGFSSRQVKTALNAHPKVDFIHVDINSDGGSTNEAFAIHAALKAHHAYVVTRADGTCASAATIVLAAGDHREAYAGAKLLLHRAEIVPPRDGRWTASAHMHRAQSLKRTDARILDVYASCAPGMRSHFEREIESETYLPLGIAKAWGLINCLAGEARWIAGRPYHH